MGKIQLALNYALMLEMVRSHGKNDEEIIRLLKNREEKSLSSFGPGIPDWITLIRFYHENPTKVEQALSSGYRISFLTKGALKNLLRIKFNLVEGKDFVDEGYALSGINLSIENEESLKKLLSSNWLLNSFGEKGEETLYKIELANQPTKKTIMN